MALFALSAILLATPARADDRSERILAQLAAKIASLGDYHARFTVHAEGNVATGTYAVSGDRYYMHTAEYEVMSDGKTRWMVNHADEEIVVDRVSLSDGNILTNPTRAFVFAPEVFTNTLVGEGAVELRPKNQDTALEAITLRVSPQTGLPTELRYRQEGLTGEVVVTITSIAAGIPPAAKFNLEKGAYKGYEVVDFR